MGCMGCRWIQGILTGIQGTRRGVRWIQGMHGVHGIEGIIGIHGMHGVLDTWCFSAIFFGESARSWENFQSVNAGEVKVINLLEKVTSGRKEPDTRRCLFCDPFLGESTRSWKIPNCKPGENENHNPPAEGSQWARTTRHMVFLCNPFFERSLGPGRASKL